MIIEKKRIAGSSFSSTKTLITLFIFISFALSVKSQYIPRGEYKKLPIERSKYIIFKDKDKVEVIANYRKQLGKKNYFLSTSNSNHIYPHQTDSIFRIYGFNNSDTLKGYNNNYGKWFFLTQDGEIKGYAERPLPILYASEYFKKDSLLFKDNFSFRNNELNRWVYDSRDAMKLRKKQIRRRTGKVLISPLLGVGCIATSILAKPDSPLAIASLLGAIPLATIPHIFRKIETSEIINIYNAC